MLTGAMPERGTVAGREEGDSVEMEEDEYPEFVPEATFPTYSREELAANVVYPELAQGNGIEGKVILLVYIDERGGVEKIEVLRATPGEGSIGELFIQAAKEGVRKTKFTPAMLNGKAINFRMTVLVNFELE